MDEDLKISEPSDHYFEKLFWRNYSIDCIDKVIWGTGNGVSDTFYLDLDL